MMRNFLLTAIFAILYVLSSAHSWAVDLAITNVSPISNTRDQIIVISGRGFGTHEPYEGSTGDLMIINDTQGWSAGGIHPFEGPNVVTVRVSSWTDNQIVISGYGGRYGPSGNSNRSFINNDGDRIIIRLHSMISYIVTTQYVLRSGGFAYKNIGEMAPSHPNVCEGNPISARNGNKFQSETDYIGGAATGLLMGRFYNSADTTASEFGKKWRSTWNNKLVANANQVTAIRADGHQYIFKKLSNGNYLSDADVTAVLSDVFNSSGEKIGWQLVTADDTKEIYALTGLQSSIISRAGLTTSLTYDANNNLTRVAGPFGHKLIFRYNANNRVAQMAAPDGGVYAYAYDASDNLISVTYPGGLVRRYLYENAIFPNALTGVIDESGNRFATYAYDVQGRAVSSQHANGAELTTLTYNYDGNDKTTVSDARGNTHTYEFTKVQGVTVPKALTGAPVQTSGGKAFTYDPNGFLASRTDWNGNITTYTHDARGNETSRTEAYGTPLARTVTTTWHPTFHLPVRVVEPNRATDFTYDANGNLLTALVTAGTQTRSFSYTYNSLGQVLTAPDPRGNVTSFAYDSRGNLTQITNPLGHTTRVGDYDLNGRPRRIEDPNGVITNIRYDFRGRVVFKSVGALATKFAYSKTGELIETEGPDGSRLIYTYDSARRLIGVNDTLGNGISYVLDREGNRIKENFYGPNGLFRTRAYQYDAVNRISRATNGQLQLTSFQYDTQGNLKSAVDPLNRTRSYSYDALNRLTQDIDPQGRPSAYGYDADDHITSVLDPRNLQTTYAWDGLDNQASLASPDTGTTTRTFDAAGNLLTSTDARGKTTTYSYDALNRRTLDAFADGTSVAYEYDQGLNGIGHLTKITDATGSTAYNYDVNGHVTRKTQIVGGITLTTAFGYDPWGRLTTITYPSGTQLLYFYDAAGRIRAVFQQQPGGILRPLATSIAYTPFGTPASWTFGNGTGYRREYDREGRVVRLAFPLGETYSLSYDSGGRILQASDSTTVGNVWRAFGYDAADRLVYYSASPVVQNFQYDANGNRTYFLSADRAATNSYSYNYETNSNRLLQIVGKTKEAFSYDLSGNILTRGATAADYTFTYDARGRMAQVKIGALTTTYGLNGLGQRVAKANPANGAEKTHFVYDDAGRLIGEYDATGALIQETVWLGDLPVITVRPTGVFYVSPDHLGAPRQITNAGQQVVWRWDHDPFGNGAPTGSLTYNLRFPGQYYDAETGLHYNYFRDYDPKLGRYVQSDPIGLAGGINTYAYVGGNPVSNIDVRGLQQEQGFFQFLFPAHTAAFSRNPIGGSAESQLTYANTVNTMRGFAGAAMYIPYAVPATAGGACLASAVLDAAYAVPATLYHFTSLGASASIAQTGLRASPGLFGTGAYGSSINSGFAATLMGAASTETSIAFSTIGLRVAPTLIPGAFRVIGNVPVSNLLP